MIKYKTHSLYKWLKSKSFNINKFCVLLGVSRTSFYKYLNREVMPNMIFLQKINVMTDGEITYKDFCVREILNINKKKYLNDEIKYRLSMYNILQKQLAYELKISNSTLSKKIHNNNFTQEEFYKIMLYLNKVKKERAKKQRK